MELSKLFFEFIIFVTGACVVGSLLMWCFKTALLVHILELVRCAGFRKKDKEFWSVESVKGFPNLDLSKWTRDDLISWVSRFNPYLGELMECPGCFSFHAAFHTSWVMLVLSSRIYQFDEFWFFMSGVHVLAWPVIGNIMLKLTK